MSQHSEDGVQKSMHSAASVNVNMFMAAHNAECLDNLKKKLQSETSSDPGGPDPSI